MWREGSENEGKKGEKSLTRVIIIIRKGADAVTPANPGGRGGGEVHEDWDDVTSHTQPSR